LREYRSESSQHVKESSQHVKESSQNLEELLAVLSFLSPDGFGSKSVLEESLHVVFSSKPVGSGLRDDRFESRA
jgi:hypothetical protein